MPVFLTPWFLLASLAAAIPIAMHLLQRRRPTPVPYGTLRFLQEALARTRRSRHLTNLVTLLLRVLLLLLLALAFARPKVRFSQWLPQGQRTVVIVLDGSASMRYRDGEKSCFQRGRAWAERLLESLDSADRVAVVVAGAQVPLAVFPPVSDHGRARRVLRDLSAGYGQADLVNGLADLLERFAELRGTDSPEIHVFSDFQANGWDPLKARELSDSLSELGGVLFLNHVPPAHVFNAGLGRVDVHPPALLGEGSVEARVQIRLAADYAETGTVRLSLDGAEVARETFGAAAGREIERVLVSPRQSGQGAYLTGTVRLDGDALDADDAAYFCLPRVPAIPVLLVDGGSDAGGGRDTFFLQAAIQPRGEGTSLFQPRAVGWSAFRAEDLSAYRIVYVCNPPELDEATVVRLQDHAASGATVVIMPGGNGAVSRGLVRFDGLGQSRARLVQLAAEERVRLGATATPLELEKVLTRALPRTPQFLLRRRLQFSALPEGAKSLLAYPDSSPFAVMLPAGEGRLWLTSVGGNRDWSDWPLSASFVILHQELVQRSAQRRLLASGVEIGGVMAVPWAGAEDEIDAMLTTPGGESERRTLTRRASDQPFLLSGFDQPGFYRLALAGEERPVAVNVPPAESALEYRQRAELAWGPGHGELVQSGDWPEHQTQIANLRQGRPLWPALLLAVFVLAVAEEILANVRSWTAGVPSGLKQFLKRGAQAST